MDKRKIILGLGIVMLLFTLIFATNYRNILFSNVYSDGETIIHLIGVNDADADAIKAIIVDNANVNPNNIQIKNVNGEVDINFDLVELDVIDTIENDLKNEFGDSLEITGYESFGKTTKAAGLYIVYILIAIAFLMSISMITFSIVLISKDKSNEMSKKI
jgi:hypothetical protein